MVHKVNWKPRQKGTKMPKKEAISYPKIKQLIQDCQDKKTQALMAYSYGFACRAGELADKYGHRKKINMQTRYFITEGSKVGDVLVREIPPEIELSKPNFKQHHFDSIKQEFVLEKYPVFVNKEFEEWLYNIILEWRNTRKDATLFRFKHSAIRSRIDKELKKLDKRYSSHWLRHSRASHIADITRDPFAVKALLGHKRVETSMRYISGLKSKIYDIVKPGTTFGDYLGK